MATPKKKISRARRDQRRFAANKLPKKPTWVLCPGCSEPVKPHSMCSNGTSCHYYSAKSTRANTATQAAAE